jgi:hypothetical protein
MPMSKSKTAKALLLVVSLIGAGVTLVEFHVYAGDKPAPSSPDTKEPEKLKTLLKQRLEFAKESFDAHQKGALTWKDSAERARARIGPGGTGDRSLINDLRAANVEASMARDALYRWAQRLLEAELDMSDKVADRVIVYKGHLVRMKKLEDLFKDEGEAKFHRLDAEVLLERAKTK